MRFIFIYLGGDQCSRFASLAGRLSSELIQVDTGSPESLFFTDEKDPRHFVGDGDVMGVVQGYVRYPQPLQTESVGAHNHRFLREMLEEKFPIDEGVSNSFAAFGLDRHKDQAVIANDVVGFYPLYYGLRGSTLIVASHLLLFHQVSEDEIDYTGVAQRLTGPEFCNFGSRTILKNASRLLPGEFIKFDLQRGGKVIHKFDNSLYRGACKTNLEKAAVEVWDVLKEEAERCFRFERELAIGLSGGMDSRILLGSLPADKNITCYTYGQEDYYETKIARRCAEAVGVRFRSFPENTTLFPDREKLREYVLETEAIGLNNQWLSILENVTSDGKKIPMALGENTEAIPGRNIKSYSTREARIQLFLGLRSMEWTSLNAKSFKAWQRKNTESVLNQIPRDDLRPGFDYERIRSETQDDLQELYRRIGSHALDYVELLDELFAWYVHARIPASNQLLLLRRKFRPVCPTMSARCLRTISTVHPSLRLNSRLMDQLFRQPDLKALSIIPAAQIPFIRYSRNNRTKLLVWGLRSKTDQLMIKISSLRKKVTSRPRLLRSINWALEYSQADPDIVNSWFSPDFVGAQRFLKTFADRAAQRVHPLIPNDIVSAAGVNLELEHIKMNRVPLSRK